MYKYEQNCTRWITKMYKNIHKYTNVYGYVHVYIHVQIHEHLEIFVYFCIKYKNMHVHYCIFLEDYCILLYIFIYL